MQFKTLSEECYKMREREREKKLNFYFALLTEKRNEAMSHSSAETSNAWA